MKELGESREVEEDEEEEDGGRQRRRRGGKGMAVKENEGGLRAVAEI